MKKAHNLLTFVGWELIKSFHLLTFEPPIHLDILCDLGTPLEYEKTNICLNES